MIKSLRNPMEDILHTITDNNIDELSLQKTELSRQTKEYSFEMFVKQNNILTIKSRIGVLPMNDEGKYHKIPMFDFNSMSVEEINKFNEDGKVVSKKSGNEYDPSLFPNNDWNINKKKFEKTYDILSVFLKYSNEWYCIDVDDNKVYTPDDFGYFKDCPYMLGNTKGIHIYVKIQDLEKYKYDQKVWHNNDFEVDLIHTKNNMWENPKKTIHNFKEDGNYPVYKWEDIKHLFNTRRMFGISDVIKKNDIKKEPNKDNLLNTSFNEKYNKKSNEYEIALNAIESLSNERIHMYDNWINAYYIFVNDFEEEVAFELWLKYSNRSSKFVSEASLREKFNSFKKNHDNGRIHIGSLIEWAKQDDKNFSLYHFDPYYLSKRRINCENITSYEYNALYFRTEKAISELINYLYPNYFFSYGEELYFFNKYGIYEKEDIKNKRTPHYNKIIDGTILYLQKMAIFFTESKSNEISEEEKEEVKSGYRSLKNKLETVVGKRNVLTYFLEKTYNSDLLKKMDEEKKNLIGFKNGVYDIEKKIFRNGLPEDYVSKTTGYDYIEYSKDVEDENLKKCYNIISSFFPSDEYTQYMLHTIGYLLHGDKKRQEVYFWLGVGGNGKSLLSLLIKNVLGDYCEFINEDYFTIQEKDVNKANGQLVKTKSTRVVFVGEPETGDHAKLQIGKIKKISSGIDSIKARDLYKENIDFFPQFSLVFLLNDIPELTKLDGGVVRRFIINKFPFMFKDPQDYDSTNPSMKLADSKIQDYIIENSLNFFKLFASYYVPKFDTIIEVKNTVNEYFDDINAPGIWFKNNYEITNNEKDVIYMKEVYDKYIEENPNNEKIQVQKFNKFINVMTNNCIKTVRRKEGMLYTRVKLKNVQV